MRDMAIITGGVFTVGAVKPGCIMRSHDVAVHTSGRIVGEVAGGVRYIKSVTPDSHQYAHHDDNRQTPPARGEHPADYVR